MKQAFVSALAGTVFLMGCSPAKKNLTSAPISPIADIPISTGSLHGAYKNAGEGAPLILIIPGSGPTDKDGNAGQGLQTNAYKFLAEGLAESGVSSVRVDKRGMYSSRAAGDPNDVTIEGYVEDYRRWVESLTERTQLHCVYLLGHSEGGLMALATAEGQDNICGVILVATPGRAMGDVLRAQLKSNPANKIILEDGLAAIDALEAGETVDVTNLHPALKQLFAPQVQGFLKSLLPANPAVIAAKLDIPILIIQGDNDLQVSIEGAERLKVAAKNGTLHILDDVNHILKKAPRNRVGNMMMYKAPNEPIDKRVTKAVTEYVKKN